MKQARVSESHYKRRRKLLMSAYYFSVLIVDDEEPMRRTLSELLRLEGFRVASAKDGDEAIREFQYALDSKEGTPYDLVLLDLKMPGKDGLDVLRYITQKAPETQVILLTAHGSLQSAIEALRHGAHDYILKPAAPDYIIKSIRQGLVERKEKRHRELLVSQLEVSIKALRSTIFQGGEQLEPISSQPNKNAPEKDMIHLWEDIYFDLARREIRTGTITILLSPTESKLLSILVQNPGRVFSHSELVVMVYRYQLTRNEAAELLRPLISRLRRKLSKIPNCHRCILNVRAQGYIYEPL
jgi:DNA-binding response OmpR family regulator